MLWFYSAEPTKPPFVRKDVHKNAFHSTLFVETDVNSVIKGEKHKKSLRCVGALRKNDERHMEKI